MYFGVQDKKYGCRNNEQDITFAVKLYTYELIDGCKFGVHMYIIKLVYICTF